MLDSLGKLVRCSPRAPPPLLQASPCLPMAVRPIVIRTEYGASSYRCGFRLDNVNKYKKVQPYNIDEMPIPGHAFKTKTVIRTEMAFKRSQQDDN